MLGVCDGDDGGSSSGGRSNGDGYGDDDRAYTYICILTCLYARFCNTASTGRGLEKKKQFFRLQAPLNSHPKSMHACGQAGRQAGTEACMDACIDAISVDLYAARKSVFLGRTDIDTLRT